MAPSVPCQLSQKGQQYCTMQADPMAYCTKRPGRQACGEKLVCLPLTGPMEGSGYGHCTAPAPPATATGNGSDGGAARAYYVRNRHTADGRACRLPLVYNGNLLLDCTSKGADGQERCFPRDGPPQARPHLIFRF